MTLSEDNKAAADFAAEVTKALFAEGYDAVSVAMHREGILGVTAQNDDEPWAYAHTISPEQREGDHDEVVAFTVKTINRHREESKDLPQPEETAPEDMPQPEPLEKDED